jgi:hypothetical protein
MGVPITIIGQLDYNQFEVVGKLNNGFIGDKKVFSRILIQRKEITKQDYILKLKGNKNFNKFIAHMAQMVEKYGATVLKEAEEKENKADSQK